MTKTTPKTRATRASKKDERGKRKAPDWEAIEREVRAGVKSEAQIAREHGITQSSLSKRKKKEGWQADLKETIRKATLRRSVEQTVARQGETKPKTPDEKDADTVAIYSQVVAGVLAEHQDLAKRLRTSATRLTGELEDALNEIEPAIQELIKERDAAVAAQARRKRLRKGERKIRPYLKAEVLAKRLSVVDRVVDIMRKTVQPFDRLIQIERQSYGLQDGEGHAVEDLSYDNLLRELHGHG